ncbi:hypothetical protein [Neorhizobium vignae]|uniref:hypothetical protein n=1 Tax=Neorhizobium vignae TaxID=690585 RepID=UPI000567B1B1|nr:hypothetical protein [Neorhizobium vignae]
MTEIEAINCSGRVALAADGRVGHITNLFDAEGNETDDVATAISAVVKLADDQWLTVDLLAFQPAEVN